MKRLAIGLFLAFTLLVFGAMSTLAQTATQLYPFTGGSTDGNQPTLLIQAQDGNFYGITTLGGNALACQSATGVTVGCCLDPNGKTIGCGTIFKLTPQGVEKPLYSFDGEQNGGNPNSLIQGPDGKLYGTTLMGGPPPNSIVDCSGVPCCQHNGSSTAPCCQDGSGNTVACCIDPGGAEIGCGTIFEYDPSQSAFTTLYTFTGTADGGAPGNLTLGSIAASPSPQSVIFGTSLICSNCHFGSTSGGLYSPNTGGTLFRFVPAGSTTLKPTTIANFPSSQNAYLAFPNSLTQWDQNTLYGTAQMGGATNTATGGDACLVDQFGPFGCGGVFRFELSSSSLLDLCNFGDTNCSNAVLTQSVRALQPFGNSTIAQPDIIVVQSGQRFPTGGNPWGFTPLSIPFAMDSTGNIYGITPPGCSTAATPPYLPDPNCAADYSGSTSEVAGTVFKLTPPAVTANSAGSINIPYTFSGNGLTPSAGCDGLGSIAGLIYATDGNLYGLSGDGKTHSEVFNAQQQKSGCIVQYASFDSVDKSYTPTSMIQGNDGNFYGVSPQSTGSDGTTKTGYGAVFKVSTSLAPPVQLCWQTPCSGAQINSTTAINLGNSATLTWSVLNAYSLTSQQCYGFVEGSNASTAGTNWASPLAGVLSSSAFGGSTTIKPTAAGTYIYAVTCGGSISASATLQVTIPKLTFTTGSLTNGVLNQAYSGSVASGAGGGVMPYTFTLASGSTLPGLALNSNGSLSGSPNAVGSFNFSVNVSDAETPAQTATASFTIVVMGPGIQVNLSAQPSTSLTYGQTTMLSATENPVEGLAQGYSWSIYEDGTAKIAGALSTGQGSYVYTTAPLTVGQHSFYATFTSTQTGYQPGTSNTVTLTVAKATPSITALPTASAITYGQTLASSTLSGGTASVAGAFTWSTPMTSPGAGTYSGSVTFTPTDTTDYNTATGAVMVTVNKATPTVTAWPTASAITAGQTLASSTLSGGAASVAGTFAWTNPTTVPAAGSYTGSVTFTPTDTTDNNTVTGTVTVTVNTPAGFTLSPAPSSVSVAQGGSGTSTITVNDVGGFSGTVTLAASGLPSGITSSFAAGTVAGTQVLTLTASASAQVTSSPVTITITGTSGALSATTSVSLSITPQPAFTAGSGGTTSMSVVPGATTGNTGTISVAGTNGFAGPVNLSCKVTTALTTVNDMPTCALNPVSVTLSGTTAQTSTLTVSTQSATALNDFKKLFWPAGGTTVALLFFFAAPRRRRHWLYMAGILLICVSIGAVGCGGGGGNGGGGGGNGNPGTTAGTYTITVTGSAGSINATVGTVTLTVQ